MKRSLLLAAVAGLGVMLYHNARDQRGQRKLIDTGRAAGASPISDWESEGGTALNPVAGQPSRHYAKRGLKVTSPAGHQFDQVTCCARFTRALFCIPASRKQTICCGATTGGNTVLGLIINPVYTNRYVTPGEITIWQ